MGNNNSAYYRRCLQLSDKFRDPKRIINLLIIGDDSSGRDALAMRYLANDPPIPGAPYAPIFDLPVCYSMIAKQRLYNVMLYNVPGDTNNASELSRRSYPRPDVIILCFSLVHPLSMENILIKWYPEIQRHSTKVPIVLAGIYSDLRDEVERGIPLRDSQGEPLQTVSFNNGVSLGERIKAAAYIECNLTDGMGVEKIFYEAAHVTGKCIPLEMGVKDKTVSHRHTVALKRYNFQHDTIVSQKLFLMDGQVAV